MNIEIKKTVRAGNSSAVVLPKAWLNKEVRVELIKKTPKTILQETIDIVERHIELNKIIGIYIVGSYARAEEDRGSDIDVLIISSDVDIEMIHEGIYNILILSKELLRWKLKHDLLPIGAMLKEAKPLINSCYTNSIKIKVTKRNVGWYMDTTQKKLQLIEKILKRSDGKMDDKISYTLVLRIRTLHILQRLIEDQVYSKKDLIRLIARTSGSNNAYESYLRIKNNEKGKYSTSKEEAEKLYTYLKNQLEDVKRL